MGYFSYDYYKNLKRPDVYLTYPDFRIIGVLHTHDLQADIYANSMNKCSFSVYRYENGHETRCYDDIEIGKYLLLTGVGRFRIHDMTVAGEGKREYKEILGLSVECELANTYLTSFGALK